MQREDKKKLYTLLDRTVKHQQVSQEGSLKDGDGEDDSVLQRRHGIQFLESLGGRVKG